MAGGELAVLTAQMNMQDPPCTGASLSEFRGLFQGPDRINYDDSSVRKAGGDLSHRLNDPVSSLECGAKPMLLKLATVKIAPRSGRQNTGSADELGGNLTRKISGEGCLT
jgi:hypothetical protein